MLPPFDAGAAQALLAYAVSHPTPQNHLSVYLTQGYSLGEAKPDPTAPPPPPEDSIPPEAIASPPYGSKVLPSPDPRRQHINVNTYALSFGKFR